MESYEGLREDGRQGVVLSMHARHDVAVYRLRDLSTNTYVILLYPSSDVTCLAAVWIPSVSCRSRHVSLPT